jgi:PspA-Associated protein
VIIRILGEGQYEVGDDRVDELNVLDTQVQSAVDTGDDRTVVPLLRDLLAVIRQLGVPLPEDSPVTSDVVVPAADTDLREVRALLGAEGFIPGRR